MVSDTSFGADWHDLNTNVSDAFSKCWLTWTEHQCIRQLPRTLTAPTPIWCRHNWAYSRCWLLPHLYDSHPTELTPHTDCSHTCMLLAQLRLLLVLTAPTPIWCRHCWAHSIWHWLLPQLYDVDTAELTRNVITFNLSGFTDRCWLLPQLYGVTTAAFTLALTGPAPIGSSPTKPTPGADCFHNYTVSTQLSLLYMLKAPSPIWCRHS